MLGATENFLKRLSKVCLLINFENAPTSSVDMEVNAAFLKLSQCVLFLLEIVVHILNWCDDTGVQSVKTPSPNSLDSW